MTVEKMVVYYPKPKRPQPRDGDRKTVKGVSYVRKHRTVDGATLVLSGRPVYEWVKEN